MYVLSEYQDMGIVMIYYNIRYIKISIMLISTLSHNGLIIHDWMDGNGVDSITYLIGGSCKGLKGLVPRFIEYG